MFDIKQWANQFIEKATDPVDSPLFFKLRLLEKQDTSDLPLEITQSFGFKVIERRSEAMGLTLTNPVKIYLSIIAEGPSTVVMYLSALRAKATSVNMTDLAHITSLGKVNTENLGKLWEAQKGYSAGEKVDNCLDHVDWDNYQI